MVRCAVSDRGTAGAFRSSRRWRTASIAARARDRSALASREYYDSMEARQTRNPPLARRMLTKHDERKMPKNLGHIESLARSYTDTAIKTLAGIMMEPNCPPMARVAAAKVLLDRGWGKPKEMHHSEVDDSKTLLKVVNEIVRRSAAVFSFASTAPSDMIGG